MPSLAGGARADPPRARWPAGIKGGLVVACVALLPGALGLAPAVPPQAAAVTIPAGQSGSFAVENICQALADLVFPPSTISGSLQGEYQVTGSTSSWVSPSSFSFSFNFAGSCDQTATSVSVNVPAGATPGTYDSDWIETCSGSYTIPNGNGGSTTTPISCGAGYTETLATITVTPGNCPNGEATGGLPSSPICYPGGLQVVDEGSVSVVDVSGGTTSGSFTSGDIANIQSGLLGVNYLGQQYFLGSDTLASDVPVDCSASGCSTFPSGASFYSTFDQQELEFEGETVGDVGLHFVAEDALDAMVLSMTGQEAILPWVPSVPAISCVMIAQGEIHLGEHELQKVSAAVNALLTPDLYAYPDGTNVSITANATGTLVEDFQGGVGVVSLKTNQTVTLAANQTVFVPRNATQAGAQNLSRSVTGFSPDSAPTWWGGLSFPSHSGNSSSPWSSLESALLGPHWGIPALGLIVVLILVILIAAGISARKSS
jgi:hypothetical protein